MKSAREQELGYETSQTIPGTPHKITTSSHPESATVIKFGGGVRSKTNFKHDFIRAYFKESHLASNTGNTRSELCCCRPGIIVWIINPKIQAGGAYTVLKADKPILNRDIIRCPLMDWGEHWRSRTGRILPIEYFALMPVGIAIRAQGVDNLITSRINQDGQCTFSA